jgi:radical SAM protein (TIGR01212 family)
VAVHVILGLPGETKSDMMATAGKVAALGIDGIKIHLLHVLKGSLLEEQYVKGLIGLLGQDEYAQLVCDFLELLPPNVVIQRLTGEGGRENHVAPAWALDKTGTIKRIKETLEQRGSFQGSKFPTPNSRLRTPD